MMQKIVLLCMVFLVIGAVSVAAEESDEITAMNAQDGAQIRLMQMQKALERNIFQGELVITEILAEDSTSDVSDLEESLANMELIKEQLQNKIREMAQFNSTDCAKEFVFAKEEAIRLTKQFKESAQKKVSQSNQEKVRTETRAQAEKEVEQLKSQIRERINNHNSEQVQNFMQKMGVDNSELVEKVKSGEMNVGNAISSVANEYKNLDANKKSQALDKVKEEKVKSESHIENVKKNTANLEEKLQERMQERTSDVEQKLEQVRARINTQLSAKGISRSGDSSGFSKNNQSAIPPEDTGKPDDGTGGNKK